MGHIASMEVDDKSWPHGRGVYPDPTIAAILETIDELNDTERTWIRLYLSEENGECLMITCVGENQFVCQHESGNGTLVLSEDVIGDGESFLSYDAFVPTADIRVSQAGAKGAAYRFNKYCGIAECVSWRQDSDAIMAD